MKEFIVLHNWLKSSGIKLLLLKSPAGSNNKNPSLKINYYPTRSAVNERNNQFRSPSCEYWGGEINYDGGIIQLILGISLQQSRAQYQSAKVNRLRPGSPV